MDLWVAAVAAGAGCLAKYWQETLKKEGGLLKQVGLSSADERSEFVKPLDKHIGHRRAESESYLFRRLVQKQVAEGFSSDADGRHSEASGTGILLEEVDTSDSADGDKLTSSDGYVRNNGSLLSLQPWIFRKENYQQHGHGEEMTEIPESLGKCHYDVGQYANFQPHLSPRNIGPVCGSRRNKSSLRSRRVRKYSVKSLSSIENCLIPQLYKDDIDFEEYVFSPFSPSSPSVRPFLVTDGNQIISKSSFESSTKQSDSGLHQQVDSRVSDVVIGIPPLQASRKPKRKCEEGQEAQHGRWNTNDSQLGTIVSQIPGLVERVIFFCLGLSIGVMSNVVSNEREMEKLNDLLKHSENLVQDLEEELEMKNSLVVRELVNESSEGEHRNNFSDIEGPPVKCDSKFSSPKQQKDKFTPSNFSREDEKKECLSKIEAELEAELERLELNLNASSLQGRMSSLAELDPDLIGNVIHGELREDIFNGKSRDRADSDGDTNGSSSSQHMANYSVSPKELSLRLYEIVQSQMEERIKELETALHDNSKQLLHFMEIEKASSHGGFSSSDLGTSNQESPVLMNQGEHFDHSLCLNLSGDALDAYNEAYEEFLRMNNMGDENPSSTTNISRLNDEDELCSSDQSVHCTHEAPMANETSTNSKISGGKSLWNHVLGGQLSNKAYCGDDIDEDDEEGMMLIRQIVERKRQGAPVLINAQKMLSLWPDGLVIE